MEQDVQQILEAALAEGKNVLIEGKVASYIPELAKADSSNLGCCIMMADGTTYQAGDYPVYHAEHCEDLFADSRTADFGL